MKHCTSGLLELGHCLSTMIFIYESISQITEGPVHGVPKAARMGNAQLVATTFLAARPVLFHLIVNVSCINWVLLWRIAFVQFLTKLVVLC